MERENGAVSTAGDDDEGSSGEGEMTPSQQENESNQAPNTTEEDQGKDRSVDDGGPAEDAAAAAVVPLPKRKSHRPSLEVVEVKVDSFYDKGLFKQELQVGRTGRVSYVQYMNYLSICFEE